VVVEGADRDAEQLAMDSGLLAALGSKSRAWRSRSGLTTVGRPPTRATARPSLVFCTMNSATASPSSAGRSLSVENMSLWPALAAVLTGTIVARCRDGEERTFWLFPGSPAWIHALLGRRTVGWNAAVFRDRIVAL
jgi:hypothetical protein